MCTANDNSVNDGGMESVEGSLLITVRHGLAVRIARFDDLTGVAGDLTYEQNAVHGTLATLANSKGV